MTERRAAAAFAWLGDVGPAREEGNGLALSAALFSSLVQTMMIFQRVDGSIVWASLGNFKMGCIGVAPSHVSEMSHISMQSDGEFS